jgi:hypothetical protein
MRRGPKPLAIQLQETRAAKRKAVQPIIEVSPLWGMPHLMRWLDKRRTSADAFLKDNPDFPRAKIGGELRFDPELCRAWLNRKMNSTGEGTTS